jgi:hypothetical protein
MAPRWTRRQALAGGLALSLGLPALQAAEEKLDMIDGKVQPLADLVRKAGSKLDADAAPVWLALVTAAGKVYPLVKDDGARMFYLDRALLNRPMRLTGRFLPGSQILQVREVRSLHKGVVCDVYYWCDICSIRRNEKHVCECCGGAMRLREEPLK